jgi:hypothetical protein
MYELKLPISTCTTTIITHTSAKITTIERRSIIAKLGVGKWIAIVLRIIGRFLFF